MKYKDREDGGQALIPLLKEYKDADDAIIIALPRGGVVTGYEIAKELHLPLDIVVPRKIGAPENEEFAIGALTEDGEPILNKNVADIYNFEDEKIQDIIKNERKEAQRRLALYRGNRKPLDLTGKTAIIVDDGIATGSTMLAAIKSVKYKGAQKIIVAVPVSAQDSYNSIKKEVNDVICPHIPVYFGAVGAFYEIFAQTEDEEVISLMNESKK